MALDHYVSQVHLRRFYSPALSELMFAMRKSNLKHFTPRSQDVCRIDEGNTNEFLSEPRAIEEFLKTVEGKYNAAITTLETGKPDTETVYVIAGFIGYLMTCSPGAMRINSGPMEGMLNATAKLLDARGMFPPPPPALAGQDLTELLESGKIKFVVDPKYPQAVGISNILQRVAAFGNARWSVLINQHDDCPFFTSDYPVAHEASADPRVLDRIVPLTPNLAVRIHPDIMLDAAWAGYHFPGFSYSRRKITRQEAVTINRLLVQCAEDTVFFRDDQPWVQGFVAKNRHFRVDTTTIDFQTPTGSAKWFRQAVVPCQRA